MEDTKENISKEKEFSEKSIKDFKNRKIEGIDGKNLKIIKEDYKDGLFENFGAVKIIFTNCDFSYSYFNRAYFNRVEFINCTFTGAIFNQSSFKNVKFNRCSFEYARFFHTILPDEEILANLPAWTNVRVELLKNLRINAQNTGNVEGVRDYLLEELDASRVHLLKVFQSKESFYKDKYDSIGLRLKAFVKYVFLTVDKYFWGHGERPILLLRSILVCVILSTILICVYCKEPFIANNQFQWHLTWKYFYETLGFYISVNPITEVDVKSKIIIGLMKTLFMGVFVTVLVRFLSKR